MRRFAWARVFAATLAAAMAAGTAPAGAETGRTTRELAQAGAPVVLIFNHGTRRPHLRHVCDESRDVPGVVRDLANANGWRIHYLCSPITDGGVQGSYTYKRAREILAVVASHRQQGVPARNIFLLGQSAGAWSSLMAARQDHSGFNAVVAFAPAFAGPRHEEAQFPHWRGTLQPQQLSYLAGARRIQALIFAYDDDTFDRPREIAPLARVPGVRIVPFNGCRAGHTTAYTQCFRYGARGQIESYLRARLGMSAPPESAAPATIPPGTPVNFTWRFRNNTGATVHVKMYARDRGIWWPGARTNWRMDGVGPHSFAISCRYGEKVCYGAWQAGNTGRYWGAGFQDRHGCRNCCYACTDGQSTLYNLNPQTPRRPTPCIGVAKGNQAPASLSPNLTRAAGSPLLCGAKTWRSRK